jgi:hypothetical protein
MMGRTGKMVVATMASLTELILTGNEPGAHLAFDPIPER